MQNTAASADLSAQPATRVQKGGVSVVDRMAGKSGARSTGLDRCICRGGHMEVRAPSPTAQAPFVDNLPLSRKRRGQRVIVLANRAPFSHRRTGGGIVAVRS